MNGTTASLCFNEPPKVMWQKVVHFKKTYRAIIVTIYQRSDVQTKTHQEKHGISESWYF